MKDLISIQIPIQDFLDKSYLKETGDVPIYTEWAKEAEDAIGSRYSYKKKIAVYTVKECQAKLNKDTAYVRFVLKGDHGCDCGTIFDNVSQCFKTTDLIGPRANSTTESLSGLLVVDTGSTFVSNNKISWEIHDNCLVFDGNFNDEDITVQYYGYETDDAGFPKIPNTHRRAVAQYVKWMWLEQQRWNPSMPITGQDLSRAEDEWHRLCSLARSDDEDDSRDQYREISEMWSEQLPNDNSQSRMLGPLDT